MILSLAPFLFQTKVLKSLFFQQRLVFFSALLSLVRGTRRWSAAASGVENVFKDEVTQEELVKRGTPPGASCRSCGGLVGAEVQSRQRCDCGSPGLRPFSGYSARVSRRQPGANPAGCDRDAASPGNGANRFRRARAFSAAGGFSGARRRDCDAASPGGSGANLCLRRDPDALAVGAVLSVVPLLLLHGCEVNVRRRRQVVSWIRIFLRSFSHACHQLTVIVVCLM